MLWHTASLIGMGTKLNIETALKKLRAECIELRRLIIIPRAGCRVPSLVPSPSGPLWIGDYRGHGRRYEQKPEQGTLLPALPLAVPGCDPGLSGRDTLAFSPLLCKGSQSTGGPLTLSPHGAANACMAARGSVACQPLGWRHGGADPRPHSRVSPGVGLWQLGVEQLVSD